MHLALFSPMWINQSINPHCLENIKIVENSVNCWKKLFNDLKKKSVNINRKYYQKILKKLLFGQM